MVAFEEKWVDITIPEINPKEKIKVSNFGRIKSFRVRPINGKILSGTYLGGYNVVAIERIDGKRKTLFVHRLVAENFVSKNSNNHSEIIHLDYDKSNNNADNLKWVTKAQCLKHKQNSKDYNKTKIRNSKLTEKKVKELKNLIYQNNHSLSELARMFNVTHTQVSRIKNGKNWAHIKVNV
jgi:predicted XRE-type DNA-binding protein